MEKTQKLLDRFIFIFFCEDTAGLLPHNTVENIYKMAQNSFSLSECKIWEQFRGLFVAIDKGNNNVNPPINAYNGGLFAYDEILDKLIIKDEMFTYIKELARYDFESDLNVNILGHIFEQSLSDLEQIKMNWREFTRTAVVLPHRLTQKRIPNAKKTVFFTLPNI